jgi:hypothetical protein
LVSIRTESSPQSKHVHSHIIETILSVLHSRQGQRLKLTSVAPFTPEYVQASLTQSSDPVGIYNSRIKGRQIILENPARDSKAKQQRDEKRAKLAAEKAKKKAGIMGRREASEKGTWKLEKEQTRCVAGSVVCTDF